LRLLYDLYGFKLKKGLSGFEQKDKVDTKQDIEGD